MIQRVQSVYLFAGIVLSFAVIFSGIFFISDDTGNLVLGALGVKEGGLLVDLPTMLPIVILSALMIVLQVAAITQYKNRNLQANLTKLNMVLTFAVMAWLGFVYYSILQMGLSIIPFVGVFHTPLILFSSILALRGISKDESLVKSVDRLR